MNITHPVVRLVMELGAPTIHQVTDEFTRAFFWMLVPAEFFYFSLYFKIQGYERVYKYLTAVCVVLFLLSPIITPLSCAPVRSMQYFTILIATMKVLDIFVRRRSLPTYTSDPNPPAWLHALLLLTELRYESFTPNHIRITKSHENFNEKAQLVIHTSFFVVLQMMPQTNPIVLAFEVLLAIYMLWTTLQILLRYKSSPALFGPLYMADSLQSFWSETWHNAFSSPVTSLAYTPIRLLCLRLGLPLSFARSFGVLAAFTFMGLFHVGGLWPLLSTQGLKRIMGFFIFNGLGTIAEVLVWGRKRNWMRASLAWAFQTVVASWTAETAGIPRGLNGVKWGELCGQGLGGSSA